MFLLIMSQTGLRLRTERYGGCAPILLLARLRSSEQSHTKSDHGNGENDCARINQENSSTGLRGIRWQYGEKEPSRNKNRRERHGEPYEPQQGGGQNRRIRQDLTHQGQNHNHSRVCMSGAKEILSQRVFHVAAVLVHQRRQQKISTVLDG